MDLLTEEHLFFLIIIIIIIYCLRNIWDFLQDYYSGLHHFAVLFRNKLPAGLLGVSGEL